MAKNYAFLPWKKGFLKLPAAIVAELTRIPEDGHFIVGCAKLLSDEETSNGTYRHLYIDSKQDIPVDFESFIPSPNVGRASFYNATPVELPDKSGVKYSKLFHGRAPTRGRYNMYTFHTTTYHRDVRRRISIPPSMSHIAFKRLDSEAHQNGTMVRFQIQEVIAKSDPAYMAIVLRCVNLLQENTGKIGLFSVNATEAEFIRTASEDIGWEVIPESKRTDVLGTLARKLSRRQPESGQNVQDRLNHIQSLHPRKILHSTRGFVGYFAVEFADNLTIFENLELGHAMYVVRTGVQEFSRLTRTQLRKNLGSDVERITHSKGWQDRLSTLVKKARGDQSGGAGELL